MAKTKISQYDATAANNTDIDSISIAEGMAPSNVNNAIRELMAHLKDMDAGTQALTSPQLTSVDINGGTIDGAVIGANSAAAITGTTITGTSLVIGDANINENDFESIDGITAGTVAASKAVIVDANKDVTGFRNITLTGELDAGSLDVSGDLDVDGTTNLDIVDIDGAVDMASTLQVDGAITSSAGATITTADNTAQLTLISTDADANAGPKLKLRRNSTSPADDDLIGVLDWTSENSDGDEHDFLNLTARMRDVTAGNEDVAYAWTAYLGGTGREIQSFVNTDASAASMVFNEDSQDIDFRVESNGNANMLFVDGGNDAVGIGTASPNSYSGQTALTINSTGVARLDLDVSDTLEGYLISESGYVGLFAKSGGSVRFGNASERMRIDSSGNVGISTTSPDQLLTVGNTSTQYTRLQFYAATNGASTIHFGDGSSAAAYRGYINYAHDSDSLQFATSATERARIDSSGNLLVGTTDDTLYNNTSGSGIMLAASGRIDVARVQDVCAILNRTGASDGSIINFAKNGTTLGNISCIGGERISIHTGTVGIEFNPSNQVNPSNGSAGLDNTLDLGASGTRWDDIFATNGTIQTSDANEKQDIAALTSTEMLVAKRISALFKTFRWKDKVAEKGDNARTHTGIVAQDVQTAFAAESLDAGDYSLFISSTWLVDSEGNEVAEGTEGAVSKTRMGIRYPELLSFVAAYNEQRFANIETRLTALEG